VDIGGLRSVVVDGIDTGATVNWAHQAARVCDDIAVTADLIDLARAGDGEAFRQLVGPYQWELQVHCYRLLGSVQDAEDAMQDALLAAWQGLSGFEGRASVRTWLYRIATTRCLNVRRSARRRQGTIAPPGPQPPEPTRLGEVTWLEPYPDTLLQGLADAGPGPGPEARYEMRESISLAFIIAVQRLPPRQRAVLILRDVLGFAASEAAQILGSTEESVTSALKRAPACTTAYRSQPNRSWRPSPPARSSSSSGSPEPTKPATWTASSPCSPRMPD
jgi:RNA polymerase sigma-70 factor (TIGR02960 family)